MKPDDKSKRIPLERSLVVIPQQKEEKKKERDSTTLAKELFLTALEQSRGLITVVCQKVNISRATYYNWRKTDKEFDAKVKEIIAIKPEVLEDRLYAEAVSGSFPALKFMLQHTHPDYKKNSKNDKDTNVHIWHHVDKPVKKGDDITYTQIIRDPKLWAAYKDWNLHKKEILAAMEEES